MPDIIDAAVAARKAHGPNAQLEALRLAAYGPRDGATELMAALARPPWRICGGERAKMTVFSDSTGTKETGSIHFV
nr:hypothetical protein [uncultured Rhodopila sp.]